MYVEFIANYLPLLRPIPIPDGFISVAANETHMLIIECHSKQRTKKKLKSKNEIHDKNVCLAKIAPSSRASKQAARVKRRKMESIYLGFIKIHKNRGFVQLQSLAAF